MVKGLEIGVKGSGFRVQGLELRVLSLGFGIWDHGLGLKV